MSEEKKVAIKKIQATGLMRKLMADYFYELDKASKEGSPKIALIQALKIVIKCLIMLNRKILCIQ